VQRAALRVLSGFGAVAGIIMRILRDRNTACLRREPRKLLPVCKVLAPLSCS
jgi:hypothetical protein